MLRWIPAGAIRPRPNTSLWLLILALPALLGTTLSVPDSITIQGRLHDDAGVVLAGPVALTVGLYSHVSSGASLLYEEDHAAVTLDASGGFAVEIGNGSVTLASPSAQLSSAVFEGGDVFVALTVDGEVLSPRQPLHSVPFALIAGDANVVQGVDVVSTQATIQTDVANASSKATAALNLAASADGTANTAASAAGAAAASVSEVETALGIFADGAATVADRLRAVEDDLDRDYVSASFNSDTLIDGTFLQPVDDGGDWYVVHYDPSASNADLRVALCSAGDCDGAAETVLDSSTTDVGKYASARIGNDGCLAVAYYEAADANLRFQRTTTGAGCVEAGAATNDLDTAGDVGSHVEFVIPSGSYPLIFHHDESNGDLKAFHCDNDACISGLPTTVVSSGDSGEQASALIASNGFAQVAYRKDASVGFTACYNASCSSSFSRLVDGGSTPSSISMILGPDGYPLIAYTDSASGRLKVVDCGGYLYCNSPTVHVIDSSGNVGDYVAMILDSDDLPLIAYRDDSEASLKLARCLDSICSVSTLETADASGDVGTHPALLLDASGTVQIFYRDLDAPELRVGNSDTLRNRLTAAEDVFNSGARFDNSAVDSEEKDIQLGGSHGVIEAVDTATSQLVLRSNSDVYILFDVDDSSATRRFRINANTSSLTTDTLFEVTEQGEVYADGGYHCGISITGTGTGGAITEADLELGPCLSDDQPADFAEMVPADASVGPGDVLAIDPETGRLIAATAAHGERVVGVHSTRPSYMGNARYSQSDDYAALAIMGIVPVKVVAPPGGIRPGDFLVASDVPGFARPCGSSTSCDGIVLGRALEGLAEGTGTVNALVRAR